MPYKFVIIHNTNGLGKNSFCCECVINYNKAKIGSYIAFHKHCFYAFNMEICNFKLIGYLKNAK